MLAVNSMGPYISELAPFSMVTSNYLLEKGVQWKSESKGSRLEMASIQHF